MKAGTIVRLPDGRIGTICYRHLDGEGGIWGRHDFSHIEETVNDEWPRPEFMLRDKSLEGRVGGGCECVGEEYEYEDADDE